jgi:SIR2-like domain
MDNSKTDLLRLPDYPALQQLARALWRNGSVRGAAVLVGAGLSKSALLPGDDTPKPPLWWELLDRMIDDLYAHDKRAAPSNPLRIAEEYRNYHGQAGLDEFIRANFPDRSWSPGPLHTELLELPWVDVLTTNWDTLLERASENAVEHSYEIVRTEADLTHARSPRIVKLHGSIGDPGPLIFAEEDYRTYPAKLAAFVNLSRQVFIENELALIGFSGDDPNFLQWAGWVRDHLGGNVRRIYLVGNLRLEHASRKYLESHNVAPIDLAPLVKDMAAKHQHAAAIRIFLDEMRNAKPIPANEWKQTPPNEFPLSVAATGAKQQVLNDPAFAAKLLEETIPLLKADREKYPGWLVCPLKYRQGLIYARDEFWLFRKSTLDILEPKFAAEATFEFLWRRATEFSPLQESLISAMTEILDARSTEVDSELRLEFALALVRHARLSNDDDELKRWTSLIEAEAQPDASIRQDAQYQVCLRARDRMDLHGVAAALAGLTSEDPVWKLRRAALHTEIGEFVKATRLIKEAAADLERRIRLDRNSLWIKSRLAWANWISWGSAMWNPAIRETLRPPPDYKVLDIDPRGEIQHIEDAAGEIQKRRRDEEAAIQPSFDAGQYREGAPAIPIGVGDSGVELLYEFDQLTELTGLPLRINRVSISAEAAALAVELAHQPTVEWYLWLLRSLHSHLDHPFKRYFGRVAGSDVVGPLISVVESAVGFWTARFKDSGAKELSDDLSRARDALRLLLFALSRLTVRMSEQDVNRPGFAGGCFV